MANERNPVVHLVELGSLGACICGCGCGSLQGGSAAHAALAATIVGAAVVATMAGAGVATIGAVGAHLLGITRRVAQRNGVRGSLLLLRCRELGLGAGPC